jgi:hypothetical protein
LYETHIDLSEAERASSSIKSMLLKLRGEFDLAPFEYTRKVRIAPGEIPHSHPVLTINTMVRDEQPLLSLYLHEQMHWYVTWYSHRHGAGWRAIWADLRARFPDVPVAFPEGAHTAQSSYLHLIVNWLEIAATSRLFGEKTAKEIASKNFVYSGIYKIVLAHWDTLSDLYREHALAPFRSATTMTEEDLNLAAREDEAPIQL